MASRTPASSIHRRRQENLLCDLHRLHGHGDPLRVDGDPRFRDVPDVASARRRRSNKGMALFPRRLDGKYAMIARQDNENLYLIYSDDLYSWDGGQAI